jgi:hypothetical protein
MEAAKRQAQANADRTGVSWVVFIDTSLMYNAERFNIDSIIHRNGLIFHPKKK